MAEEVVVEALKKGDLYAAKFYLETLGKGRGFTRRLEMTGKAGGAIQLAVPSDIMEARKRNEAILDALASRAATETDDLADPPRGEGITRH